MANNNIQYTVKIDIDLTKDILNQLKEMSGSLKNTEETLNSMPFKFAAIGTALQSVIALSKEFFGYLSAPLQAAGKIEQYEATLKNLLGNTAMAKERLKELSDFAAITPFNLQGVVEAGNSLQTLNKYSIDTLRTLGDLAAAAGKPVDEAIAAYTKLATGQRGIAIKMFRQLLITQRDWELATEKSVETHGRAIKKTGMTTADMLTALPEIIRKKNFAGLMDVQSKTLLGIESNLEDNLFRLKSYIGAIFSQSYKDSMQFTIRVLDIFVKNIKLITTLVKGLALEIILFIAVAKGMAIIELIMTKVVSAVNALIVAMKALRTAMIENPWGAALVAAVALGVAIYTIVEATKEDTEKALANAKAQEELQRQLLARKEAEKAATEQKKLAIEKYIEEKKKADETKVSTDEYKVSVEQLLMLYPSWRTNQNGVAVGADALGAQMRTLTATIKEQTVEIDKARVRLYEYIVLAAKAARDKSIADLLAKADDAEESWFTRMYKNAASDIDVMIEGWDALFSGRKNEVQKIKQKRENEQGISAALGKEIKTFTSSLVDNTDPIQVVKNLNVLNDALLNLGKTFNYSATEITEIITKANTAAGAQLSLTYTRRDKEKRSPMAIIGDAMRADYQSAPDKKKWFEKMEKGISNEVINIGGIPYEHVKKMGLDSVYKQILQQIESDNPIEEPRTSAGSGGKTKVDPLDADRSRIDESLKMLKLRSTLEEKDSIYLSPENYAVELAKIQPLVQKYYDDRVKQAKAANKAVEVSDVEYFYNFLELVKYVNDSYLAKLEERTGKAEVALSRKNIDNHKAASLEATINDDNQKMLEIKQAELDAIKNKVAGKTASEAEITRMYKLKGEINALTDSITAYAESLKFAALSEKKTTLLTDGVIPLDKFKAFFKETVDIINGSGKTILDKISALTQQRDSFDTNLDLLSQKEATVITEDKTLSEEEKAKKLKDLAIKYLKIKIDFHKEVQSIIEGYAPTETADRVAKSQELFTSKSDISGLETQLKDAQKPDEKSFLESMREELEKYVAFANDAVNKIQSIFSDLYNMQQESIRKNMSEWIKAETKKLDASEKSALKFARTEAQKERIAERYAKKREALDEEAKRKAAEEGKTLFDLQKAASIAAVAVSVAEGIAKAMAMIPTNPVMGWIYAALIAASGATQTAVIASQEYPSYATGGYTGDGGKLEPAGTVHKGEFVVDAEKTARYRPLLEFLHKESYVRPNVAVGNHNVDANGGLISEMKKLNSNFEYYAQQKTNVFIGDKQANRIVSTARKNINKGRL